MFNWFRNKSGVFSFYFLLSTSLPLYQEEVTQFQDQNQKKKKSLFGFIVSNWTSHSLDKILNNTSLRTKNIDLLLQDKVGLCHCQFFVYCSTVQYSTLKYMYSISAVICIEDEFWNIKLHTGRKHSVI